MSESGFSIAVVWSDVDLLEIQVAVRFDRWAGAERAYVVRDDLISFAAALDVVADGGTAALLAAGQRDLGYATARVFEYGGPRRLGLAVVVGHGGDPAAHGPDHPRELRVSLPIERGALPALAIQLRDITRAERGIATLWVPPSWPL